MSRHFSSLGMLSPDPLLSMMALAGQDGRREKVDVSVGVYRNAAGFTPVMKAVREAERTLAGSQVTKVYEGQRGNAAFCESIERLCLGDELRAMRAQNIISYTTPGGCGALWAGMAVAKRANPSARVWISDPTWINHRHVAASAGLEVLEYRYWDSRTQSLDFDGLVTSLAGARAGDIVVMQGPCHNPTGTDLTTDQWAALSDMFAERGLIAFLDIAYHGFGVGLDGDLAGPRFFMSNQSEFLVSYSCSKNFGLYRERTGCLIAAGDDAEARERLSLHIADVTRAGYSMPPAHGAAIVETILNKDELRAAWISELDGMRRQIEMARKDLQAALSELMGRRDFDFVAEQKGMFSVLPLCDGGEDRLRTDHAIYIPSSGRINFAALNSENVQPFARALALELAE